MLLDAARNHRSWFGRGRELVELEGVALFVGPRDAILAFPADTEGVSSAVRVARETGVVEISTWALRPDDSLGARLSGLDFQDGWAPHWMGLDPRRAADEPAPPVEETAACAHELPYSSEQHRSVLGRDVHHFVVRDGADLVGHAVLNVDGETAGIYDMGVAPRSRRRGLGRALTLAALGCARDAGCTSVTLNATGQGEPLYRALGFESLGHGMTWWLFPGR